VLVVARRRPVTRLEAAGVFAVTALVVAAIVIVFAGCG
jgi:hypothetical protein